MESSPDKKEQYDIEITGATPDNAEGINRVFYEAWLATYPNAEAGIKVDDIEDSYKNTFTPEYTEKSRRRFENIPENERRIVTKVGNKVIGILRVFKEEDNNKLQTLYILPEYQGKGVGTKLWQAGKEFLDSTKDTYLEVVDYNQNAINFYKGLGFEDTGKRITDERFRMKSGSIFSQMEMRRPADNKKL